MADSPWYHRLHPRNLDGRKCAKRAGIVLGVGVGLAMAFGYGRLYELEPAMEMKAKARKAESDNENLRWRIMRLENVGGLERDTQTLRAVLVNYREITRGYGGGHPIHRHALDRLQQAYNFSKTSPWRNQLPSTAGDGLQLDYKHAWQVHEVLCEEVKEILHPHGLVTRR